MVLVVEDDTTLRRILAVALGRAGYQVFQAADGEEAWGLICNNPIDLLISDNDMPILNGLDLLKRVRFRCLALPVIFMSGVMPWHDKNLRKLVLPGLLLEKPFELQALFTGIQVCLDPAYTTRE